MDKNRTARDTTELLHDLKSAKSIADYFEKNQSALGTRSLPECLHTLLKQISMNRRCWSSICHHQHFAVDHW